MSAWLEGLRRRDPYLADETRVVLLAEHAAVAVRHPGLAEIPDLPYRYAELLSMLWREPVTRHLHPGEQARTMASLLLVGPVLVMAAPGMVDPVAAHIGARPWRVAGWMPLSAFLTFLVIFFLLE